MSLQQEIVTYVSADSNTVVCELLKGLWGKLWAVLSFILILTA